VELLGGIKEKQEPPMGKKFTSEVKLIYEF